MKLTFRVASVALIALAFSFGVCCRAPAPPVQPVAAPIPQSKWATPLQKPGLPNLFKVSDDLYRGAQPTDEGFRQLKEMGIKTVVNLRVLHSDRDEMGDVSFDYERFNIKAWHPEDEDIIRFLKIVTDKSRAPVFVHCQYGADRTGTMVAVYRVAVCGWSKDDAIAEMTQGGYGFHPMWQNLVAYVRGLDIDWLKKKAGLGPPEEKAPPEERAKPPTM